MALTHGILDTYVNHRCRCAPCAAASAQYARTRSRLHAYGRIEELVSVDVVAAHIAWLATQGIGWERVAVLAGVGRGTIDQVVHPRTHRRGVTPRVARAVLAIVPTLDDLAPAALLPAAGTRRRIQALMHQGWTLSEIQRRTGTSALDRCLKRELVTARVARAVRDFYDVHWNLSPSTDTARSQAVIDRTRARARRAGWLPPLAWDEDTIDDPDAEPPMHALRPDSSRTRIHLGDVLELVSAGATWAELEDRTGACRNSIEVALRRAGRSRLISRITSNRWVTA